MFYLLHLTRLLCFSLLSSTMWIDALQRKADEETLVLQKLTTDWQNYSRVLSAIKSNTSSTTQNMRSLQNNVVADHQRIAMSTEVYYDLTQQVFVCLQHRTPARCTKNVFRKKKSCDCLIDTASMKSTRVFVDRNLQEHTVNKE